MGGAEAHGFTETEAGLRYREHLAIWARLFIGIIGAALVVLTAAFLTAVPWVWQTLGGWLFVPCLLAMLAFGALALWVGLRGDTEWTFDTARRAVVRTSRGLGGTRSTAIAFDRVGDVAVAAREGEDGRWYLLELRVAGLRRPLQLGAFDTRDDAERWQTRIAALVLG